MAISAKFEADFSQFTTAVRGAEKSLKDLEAGGTKVAASVEQIGSTMQGISRAIAGAFTVGAVVNFGREILRAADELQELHDRTGLSTDALQRFAIAGADAGNTVGELAKAAVQLQDRVAGGDRSALQALKDLGIALNDFKALRPEDQLTEVAHALQNVGNSQDQIRIVNDLLGKMGAEVLPTLKRGFDDLEDAPILSGQAITRLDAFGDALGRATQFMKDLSAEALAFSIAPVQDIAGLFQDLAAAEQASREQAELLAPKLAAIPPPGLPEDLSKVNVELTRSAEALIKVNEKTEEAVKGLLKMQKVLVDVLMPGTSKAAESQRIQDLITGQTSKFDEMGFKTLDFSQGGAQALTPTGAYKMILDQATAEREHAEALELVKKQMDENLLIVGALGQAHTASGQAGVEAADRTTAAYERMGHAVKSAFQVNVPQGFNYAQAYSDAGFFVHDSPFLGLSKPNQPQNLNQASLGFLPRGQSSIFVNVDAAGAMFDTPDGQQQFFHKVGESVQSQMMSQGRSMGSAA